MDYETMWLDLIDEMRHLRQEGVHTIDPEIVRAFMSYIEQRQELREQLESRDAKTTGAGE